MTISKPKLVILAVYKSKESFWRGFCAPYDVTCNASTKEQAMKQIEELVELYEDGLKQYDYPKHLSIKPLTDPEDQRVFQAIIELISEQISEHIRERFLDYQKESSRNPFMVKNAFPSSGYYYEPQRAR